MSATGLLLRSALLGAASGGRSSVGAAALAWTSDAERMPVLGSAGARVATTIALLGELATDKKPQTPSRIGFPQVLGRIGAGAGTAAMLARRSHRGVVLPAIVGAAAAAAASVVGVGWRKVAAERFGSDLPGAFAEDAVTVLIAFAATAD